MVRSIENFTLSFYMNFSQQHDTLSFQYIRYSLTKFINNVNVFENSPCFFLYSQDLNMKFHFKKKYIKSFQSIHIDINIRFRCAGERQGYMHWKSTDYRLVGLYFLFCPLWGSFAAFRLVGLRFHSRVPIKSDV